MIVSQANLGTLFAGYKTEFNRGLMNAESEWMKVAMKVPSGTAEEEYAGLKTFAGIREWVGERVIHNLGLSGFTIKNLLFESTVSVPRTTIEDDQFGVFGRRFEEMGAHTAAFPDEKVFGLLSQGFAKPAYDGQNFFDDEHPVIDDNETEVSVSNFQDGAATPWFLIDGSKPMKPLVWQERMPFDLQRLDRPDDENVFFKDEYIYGVRGRANAGFALWQLAFGSKAALTADNYGAARAAMRKIFADGGRKLNIKPTHLVVPPDLEQTARQLLFGGSRIVTTGAPAGDTTHVSISNEWLGSAELIVTNYL